MSKRNVATVESAKSRVSRLAYVDELPEVGGPILEKRRVIQTKVERIEALRAEIARLDVEVFRSAGELDQEIERSWSEAEINIAKRNAGRVAS